MKLFLLAVAIPICLSACSSEPEPAVSTPMPALSSPSDIRKESERIQREIHEAAAQIKHQHEEWKRAGIMKSAPGAERMVEESRGNEEAYRRMEQRSVQQGEEFQRQVEKKRSQPPAPEEQPFPVFPDIPDTGPEGKIPEPTAP